MKFIVGTKQNMTQIFKEDGTVVPVTRVVAGPCVVTQVKKDEKDGTNAIQVGIGAQKKHRLTKAEQGHLNGLPVVRLMREVKSETPDAVKRGDTFTVKIFEAGEKVKVTGRSKGKGFQGVVKRHNFKGSPASHGHKDQLRMPGSIGATDAARVFKGTRMGGHMGDQSVTVKNLEIVEVHPETNELFIKGAVPGARGGVLIISTPEGEITVEEVQAEAPAVEEKTEVVTEETATPVAEETTEAPAEEKQEEVTEAASVVEEKKEEAPAEAEEKQEETK